jgi:curli production assembly/transport component CsgE
MTSALSFKNLALLSIIFIHAPSYASNKSNEIQGLILDRTVTLSGHSFYKKFSAHWLAANLSQPSNIVLTETPSARWGNLIVISSQNKILYRTSIRPGKPFNNSIIKEAASTVSQNVFNNLLSKNDSNDMSSSGY